MEQKSAGYVYAASAYLMWGLLPLYWSVLNRVPALSLLTYRIAFSFLFSWGALAVLRTGAFFRRASGQTSPGRWISRRAVSASLPAAALIAVNWFTYIWAVVNGFTLEASLGYFLTPLVNVLLGLVLLGERPGLRRAIALGFSLAAVIILTVDYGRPPIVALTVAFSFGSYGYVKKRSPSDSLTGMALETSWLIIPAAAIMLGGNALEYLVEGPPAISAMLVLAGPVTLAPLLLFASAARRIPLFALGFFQYIAPILMFIIGWLVFKEEVGAVRLISFGLVWVALGIFISSIIRERRDRSG